MNKEKIPAGEPQGKALSRFSAKKGDNWLRGTHPMTLPNVVLYTRRGCHLCEEAQQVLQKHGLRARLVDIDSQPELREQFDTCVPVVEIDGRVRFRGRIDEVLLRRLLRSAGTG